MDGDVHGVRIIPPIIEFKDIEVNVLNKINITVKNVSKTSKEIRYWHPTIKNFKLKVKNPDKPVAPGLEVAAVLEYETKEAAERKDRVVVTVDGEVIEVPIRAYPTRPNLVLEGPVDFGNVVANSKVIGKEIMLYNHGSREGEFKIKYTGDRGISVLPSSGKVPPNSVQIIKVEYVTKQPGSFDVEAKVNLEGQEPSTLQIRGRVVEGGLELLSCTNEQRIECVRFASTYYGTDRTESALLYNNGPEPVCFVAVLDEEAAGQEVGFDATQGPRDPESSLSGGEMNALTSLVTCIPNQGMLAPYEKIPVFFRFSPRWNEAKQGFRCSKRLPPRQDFALFMHIKVVGASSGQVGVTEDQQGQPAEQGSSLEVALTGTALPVLMTVTPSLCFDFDACAVGLHVDALCRLGNESGALPISFQFRRVAHFTAHPASGQIKPGASQEVVLTFTPRQVGTFKPTQFIDIIGQVADSKNPFLMHLEVIHSVALQLSGRSDPVTVKRAPVFNPGITPKISNEVGLFMETEAERAGFSPRAALHRSQATALHAQQGTSKASKDQANNKTLLAYPNDRAASIRPSTRNHTYKTPFTRVERHSYVDPDYSYTDAEAAEVRAHRQYYVDLIAGLRERRSERRMNKEHAAYDTETDLAIVPASGLKPRKIALDEVRPDPRPPTPPNSNWKLLSSKDLASQELTSAKKLKDGLNAVPSTPQEKAECGKVLSPQELHQIVIGPPTIDFGKVCFKSVSQREIHIINNLDQHVHINVHVDCRELRQTSPLSQVVPPRAKAALPLIFESNAKGKFQRSLDYTINGFYHNHITVFAEVVSVQLELSTDTLVLEPTVGLPADAGIRGVITLRNPLNASAEFTWSPILGERGTAFSVRPATGSVEAGSELDCEVVFHPSYLAPDDGEFMLQVHGGGRAQKLACLAKLGATNVQFIDRRLMFDQVPLHLTTTRTAMLKNTSLNHAYFQVLDPNPFPALTVSPLHGVVPVGGVAELKVHLTPNAQIKFDTRVNVSIRGWKTLELRMGGTVELPSVDIDMPTFQLGGVYCGSHHNVQFTLRNKAHTKARVEFDLSRYSDFSLEFPQNNYTAEDNTFELLNPGYFTVGLEPDQSLPCVLHFRPTEVASYDFVMPVSINQTVAPSPAATPLPPTPAPSHKNSLQHIIAPRLVPVTVATPRRRVVATALRMPLQLSSHSLQFTLSPAAHEMASGVANSKSIVLVNNGDKPLRWALDLSRGNEVLEAGVFKFLHATGMPYLSHSEEGGGGGVGGSLHPGETTSLGVTFCPSSYGGKSQAGHYEVTLPVILNGDLDRPYQHVTLVGELQAPRLTFDPLALVLAPAPLDTEISATCQILATNYLRKSVVEACPFEVELEDGNKMAPLTVEFKASKEIPPCCTDDENREPHVIEVKVTFKSHRPVTFSQTLTFKDDLGNCFCLPVTATADNCLLTCYPFLAQHRADHQIVCEQGHTLKGRKTQSRESVTAGEAVLVPCETPTRETRASTTETSSNFEVSSSSYESSTQTATESQLPSTPRDGALNKLNTESALESRGGANRQDLASRSLGSALFPEEDTEEGVFHNEVLLAVQRWFAAQGWPSGPNPIIIPDTLRAGLTKKPVEEKVRTAKGHTLEANNLKEFKTVYDMINHLCGRQIPGIPINNPLPRDPQERAKQVYWQHSTLLTFLRTQGACVASIKPEYLMEPQDYNAWVSLQRVLDAKRHAGGHRPEKPKTEEEEAIEEQLFEAVSKRAWTDVLLQLLKTLVLSKITPTQFSALASPYSSPLPRVDPDPLCSNVYSGGERILLLWLNHHYEQQRNAVWRGCSKGGVPPSRWVVNFDFDLLDGLVFAAALAAHAPFLIETHLRDMYSQPATAEQCLHNALKVVNALRHLGIDYDIQAIDITDPNPVALLLLSAHLYSVLPQYLPRNSVQFVGGLHQTCARQVRLKNPSNKPLTYHALLAGKDARDFRLPRGDTVVLQPKSTFNLTLEFTSRFLRGAEAVLVLVGRRQGAGVGTTLVFSLTTLIDDITPQGTVKCESACYEVACVPVEVANPFSESGTFRVVLVESRDDSGGGVNPLGGSKKRKPKKIRSRIDNGRKKGESDNEGEEEGSPRGLHTQPSTIRHTEGGDAHALMAFHTKARSVYMEGGGSATVDVLFLPFHTGPRRCSVILACDTVGEIIYAVEAVATPPLPAQIPFTTTSGPHSVRISSAAAQGAEGHYGGDKVVYWKCEVGQLLQENLSIPVQNESRQQALVAAAQLHLSEQELSRRRRTGTLTSDSLSTLALELLTTGGAEAANMRRTMSQGGRGVTFKVECNSNNYKVPAAITIPLSAPNSPSSSRSQRGSAAARINKQGATELFDIPVQFRAKEPGHYPCQLTLRAQDDIRVFRTECTVVAEGSQAELEFSSPVHEPLTQDIPVINDTRHDWSLEARIDGMGFFGPDRFTAKAGQTTFYPLLFRPPFEGLFEGKLVLANTSDGIDHVFTLRGNGQRPLPLQTLKLSCRVRQSVQQVLEVPNLTARKLYYEVESDLSCMTGADSVTVLPGRTGYYDLTVCPLRRGKHRGVLAFVARANPVKEVDSDGEDVATETNDDSLNGYRVWFSVELDVQATQPEKTLDISCACQKKAVLEIGVSNPTDEDLTLEAAVSGVGLSGPPAVTLPPRARAVYSLFYCPAVIGTFSGSVVFYAPQVGEFWYALNLVGTTPAPITLDHMECELGRFVTQNVTLTNPTDETLRLVPLLSNSNNYSLARANDQPVELRPHSTLRLPLTFTPSSLGTAQHKCKISFMCQQLGELEFRVTGGGTLPQPQDPVSVTALAGSSTTLIVPFRNPLDTPVLVDVYLKDCGAQVERVLDANSDVTAPADSPFCLLLRQNKALRLGPKASLDVPVSFAPEDMRMFEARLTVALTKQDRSGWVYVCSDENGLPLSRTNSGGLRELKWEYPIRGYPELTSSHQMAPATVTCKARQRTEERLEVTLSGVAPSASAGKRGIKARAITPKGTKPKAPEGVIVGETLNLASELTYEMIYGDNEARDALEPCLGLSLVRAYRDKTSGQLSVVFTVVFAPHKQMKHNAQLLIQAATGGLWRFPVTFAASEPDADDTIIVEAQGLNVQSAVGFKLYSPNRQPVPYSASFVAGSDPEFDVTPATGELLPYASGGTLIKVTFKPPKYGRLYRGTLQVSSGDKQWTYNVRGVLPDYQAPRGSSSKPIAGPHEDPRRRHQQVSYVKENLRLTTTAVSSPIKGAPIIRKAQQLEPLASAPEFCSCE